MRRWWVILLCVLIGVGVHLAAAYDGWPPERWSGSISTVKTGPAPWPGGVAPAGYPSLADRVSVYRGFWLVQEDWRAKSLGVSYHVHRSDWGWPLASLSRTEWWGFHMTNSPGPRWGTVGPTRALWAGLLLNTAAYAIMAWGALWAVAALHHSCRPAAAGSCAGCGYDLSGLAMGAVCPECGAAAASGAAA